MGEWPRPGHAERQLISQLLNEIRGKLMGTLDALQTATDSLSAAATKVADAVSANATQPGVTVLDAADAATLGGVVATLGTVATQLDAIAQSLTAAAPVAAPATADALATAGLDAVAAVGATGTTDPAATPAPVDPLAAALPAA
jgi:hypothetical protein